MRRNARGQFIPDPRNPAKRKRKSRKGTLLRDGASLKEALAALDKWAYCNAQGQDLWNVLTALRGPDSFSGELKNSTTAIIRHHALPISANSSGAIVRNCDSITHEDLCEESAKSERFNRSHFVWHVRHAANALGIPVVSKET